MNLSIQIDDYFLKKVPDELTIALVSGAPKFSGKDTVNFFHIFIIFHIALMGITLQAGTDTVCYSAKTTF